MLLADRHEIEVSGEQAYMLQRCVVQLRVMNVWNSLTLRVRVQFAADPRLTDLQNTGSARSSWERVAVMLARNHCVVSNSATGVQLLQMRC